MFNKFAAGATASMTAAMTYMQYQRQRSDRSHAEGRPSVPFFKTGVHLNPKYEKRYKGGEDACLVSDDKRMVGVADGVGGWGEVDICSGKCSKFLCKKVTELYDADNSKTLDNLLLEGHKALKDNQVEGSTTLVLAKLEAAAEGSKESTMHTLNLGDSVYMLLRT